jgi:hypothetical protein
MTATPSALSLTPVNLTKEPVSVILQRASSIEIMDPEGRLQLGTTTDAAQGSILYHRTTAITPALKYTARG